MGLVKKGDESAEPAADAPEDPPMVKQLKELDDKYLDLEKEYEKEVAKLVRKYTDMQQPLLEERKKVLLESDGDAATPATGTPALQGFWLKAMQNHPAFESLIQEWDEPVLEYLQDIERCHVDDEDFERHFKITFKFLRNPYFTNTELTKEYLTEVKNPYSGEIHVKEIKAWMCLGGSSLPDGDYWGRPRPPRCLIGRMFARTQALKDRFCMVFRFSVCAFGDEAFFFAVPALSAESGRDFPPRLRYRIRSRKHGTSSNSEP